MISQEDIQKVIETAKVEEIISEFINLKKRGVNYIGLCPFHNEKTPSFTVSPTKNIFKCFGCGKSGSSVGFLMEHEHYTYPEAIRYLAAKYGIEIQEQERTEKDIEAENEKNIIFHLHTLAQKFYFEALYNSDEGKSICGSYLKERGFTEKSIQKFGVGYCPEGEKNGFVDYATGNGYKIEDIVKAGLTVNETYHRDKFNGRITFPIYSISGRVLGFGGRLLKQSDKAPKYLNSPETLIYHKSKILYGLNFAKAAILKYDNCYLVEGYTDVISLHQAEILNVVASSGTSLTEEQIRLIKRYTTNITVVFDGDEAGIKASFRGIDLILGAGMNVKVVIMPDGEDPDSFVKKNRDTDVERYLNNNTISFILFKTRILSKDIGDDPIKKSKLIKDIINSISLIPDGITRSLFIKECSKILKVGEDILINEVTKNVRNRLFKQIQKSSKEDFPEDTSVVDSLTTQPQIDLTFDDSSFLPLEIRICKMLVSYGTQNFIDVGINENNEKAETERNVAGFIVSELLVDEFLPFDKRCRKFFDIFADSLKNDFFPDENFFIQHSDIEIQRFSIDLLASPYTLSSNWKQSQNIEVQSIDNNKKLLRYEIMDIIIFYKILRLKKETEEIDKQLELCEDIDEQNDLIVKRISYQKVMKELAGKLGIILYK